MHNCTLPSTSALDGSEWSTPRSGRSTSRERPGIHFIEGPTTGLDGCGKSRSHRDSIPGSSSPYRMQNRLVLIRHSSQLGLLPCKYWQEYVQLYEEMANSGQQLDPPS